LPAADLLSFAILSYPASQPASQQAFLAGIARYSPRRSDWHFATESLIPSDIR